MAHESTQHRFLPKAINQILQQIDAATANTVQGIDVEANRTALSVLRDQDLVTQYEHHFRPVYNAGQGDCAFRAMGQALRDLFRDKVQLEENQTLLGIWNQQSKRKDNWYQFCEHIATLDDRQSENQLHYPFRLFAWACLKQEQKAELDEIDLTVFESEKDPYERAAALERTLRAHANLGEVMSALDYYARLWNGENPQGDKPDSSFDHFKSVWKAKFDEGVTSATELKIWFLKEYKKTYFDEYWKVRERPGAWEDTTILGSLCRALKLDLQFIVLERGRTRIERVVEHSNMSEEPVDLIVVKNLYNGHWEYCRSLERCNKFGFPSQARQAASNTDVQIALWFLSFVAGLFIAIFATAPLVAAIASLGVPALAAAFAAQKFLFGLGSFVLFSLATRFAMWVTPKIITGLCILFKEEKVHVSASTSSHPSGGPASTETPGTSGMDRLHGDGDDAKPTDEDEANPSEQVTSQVKTGTDSSDISLAKPEEQATIAADPR